MSNKSVDIERLQANIPAIAKRLTDMMMHCLQVFQDSDTLTFDKVTPAVSITANREGEARLRFSFGIDYDERYDNDNADDESPE